MFLKASWTFPLDTQTQPEVVDSPPNTVTGAFYRLSTRLRDKESLSASEAAKKARSELEDAEGKAQQALVSAPVGIFIVILRHSQLRWFHLDTPFNRARRIVNVVE